MKDLPYWLDIPYTPRAPLLEDRDADVAVIGAGITGVSVAYHCAKAGLKTILIEKEIIAFGSAGRNGGMVVDGLALDFNEAIEKFGKEEAKELWINTVKARKHVISLINEHRIDCDFNQLGSLYIGFNKDDSTYLKKEAEVRESEGLNTQIIEKGAQFRSSPFEAALLNPEDCALHPVKFIRALASIAEEYGALIYENTPALKFDAHSIRTPKGMITAKKVIVALESTNPYITEKEARIIRSQAIVTEPLSDEKMEALDWKIGEMLWVTGKGYISCRKIGNRLFACKGLPVEPTAEEREQNKNWQIDKLLSFFPALDKKDLSVSHQWSGLMVYTRNHRPYIRENKGCYEVWGQAGNGLTNGIMCGKLLADAFSGAEIPAVYR